ncbi:hypothetical protein ZIOFF_034404 [Zingiber officinale]|uniref:Phytosulfokine n=1 Tax=Zingiber officinale TaxID=94328 RepID=A0A8J5LDH2_ZINOF|nr:hypothetical protein ZIOFF_034404 [Zingiber officinale]
MAKHHAATFFFHFLLLSAIFLSCHATRHEPADHPLTTHQKTVEKGSSSSFHEEFCGKGVDEEECLMRRTLVAHTDYIYTQGNKN